MTDKKELGKKLLAENGLDSGIAETEHESQISAVIEMAQKKLHKRNRDAKWLWVAFLLWPAVLIALMIPLFGNLFRMGDWMWLKLISANVFWGWCLILPLAIYCSIARQLAKRDLMMTNIQSSLAEIAEELKRSGD